MATTVVGRSGIDTSDLKLFARSCRAAGVKIPLSTRTALRVAGNGVRDEARNLVSPYSKKVPKVIRTSVTKTLTVAVTANAGQVPLAGLFELGNSGGGGGGTFRAPNFPDKGSKGPAAFERGGHAQPMHPYLAKALANKTADTLVLIGAVLDEAIVRMARI